MQKLCVTVTAPTMAELLRRRDAVVGADLVELRLDSVSDPDVAGALRGRPGPVVVTCRPTWEGGAFAGSEEERKRLLAAALSGGAEYVDIEARAGFDDLIATTRGKRIVLSLHDFDGIPTDLDHRLDAMLAVGADVVKVAVRTRRLDDCVTLLERASRARAQTNLVLIGIGEPGLITRILPARMRSKWAYAGDRSEVGQLTPEVLSGEFRFAELGPQTALFGVVGSPVSHSVSPAMHNEAFRETRTDGVYLPLAAADVDDFIRFAQTFGLAGASITIPFKVPMFGRVDVLSAEARRTHAINTVKRDRDQWLGDNTDVAGFLQPLNGLEPLSGRRSAILGAGGAARSVAVALASKGARVTVHARNAKQAAEVAALVAGAPGSWPPEPGSWDLLVNCTPVGLYPHVDDTPIDARHLAGGTVYDLVYNPVKTRLLRDAERAGCRTIGGLEMLVGQARRQFEWWTGVRPSAEVMRRAALRKLKEFASQP